MKRRTKIDRRGSGLSWRAFVFSFAVYILGMATTIFGAQNLVLYYAGLALIAVGAIAVSTAVVDGLLSVSRAFRTALALAAVGIIAYVIWTAVAP